MHCHHSHIESMLADAEPAIRFLAGDISFPGHGIDCEDVRQYLRVEAWKLAESFDADPRFWVRYATRCLRWRVADLMRKYGPNNRQGQRKRGAADVIPFSALDVQHGDHPLTFDPADHAGDHTEALAWQELEAACQSESLAARSLVKRARGLRLHEIADQEGVHESRISQVLNPRSQSYVLAVGRIRMLIGEPT